MKSKIISAADAVALIHDGDTLVCSGFGMVGVPDQLLVALETGEAPALTGRDNLKSIALVEAAALSAAEHRMASPQEIIDLNLKTR